MGDSRNPHESPYTSTPVASDGRANDGRCSSQTGTTSKNTATGQKCDNCKISLEKRARKEIVESSRGVFCRKCYWLSRNNDDSDTEIESGSEDEPMSQDESQVRLDVESTISYHQKCILKVCDTRNSITEVPKRARVQALRCRRLFIPRGARCCKAHLRGERFKIDVLESIPRNENITTYKESNVRDMLNMLLESNKGHWFDQMDDRSLRVYTGRSQAEFDTMIESLAISSTYARKAHAVLGVYLTYLYAGFTQDQISVTFGIPQQTVSDYIRNARNSLRPFVDENLGLRAFTRRSLIQHRTQTAERLYNLEDTDNIITVWDAT